VVSVEEFVREPLIEVPTRDPIWRDYWTAAEHRDRRPPDVAATVHALDGLIEAVAVGLGVALTVAPVIDMLGAAAGVTFRPVAELAPLNVWVAHRQGDARPEVAAFRDAAITALRTS